MDLPRSQGRIAATVLVVSCGVARKPLRALMVRPLGLVAALVDLLVEACRATTLAASDGWSGGSSVRGWCA
jgi:hypothetical protein